MQRRLIIIGLAILALRAGAEPATHAGFIRGWNAASLKRGEEIYRGRGLCITCHGDLTHPPPLAQAQLFQRDPLKGGKDPVAMYNAITEGYGLMPAQPKLTPRDVYDAIQFTREALIKGRNPSQYFEITDEYLKKLPTDDLNEN